MVGDGCEEFGEVSLAGTHIVIVAAPSPAITIKVIIGCVHHTMQHDLITLVVLKESTIHMQGRHT